MKRIYSLYVGIIAVMASLILAVRLVSNNQPNPLSALFTNPDGSPCVKPCLFGVRPGETTLDDALKILDRHPLTHSLKQQPYITLNAKGQSVQRGAELLSRGADLVVMSDDGIEV